MMSVAQSQELKAKLQTKGKVRPHKMVSKKMPDGSTAALTELPKRLATGAAAEKAYCDAIDKVSGVFSRQRRSVSTAQEHMQYMPCGSSRATSCARSTARTCRSCSTSTAC